MDPNLKLLPAYEVLSENQERYKRLVRKLNYLIISQLDIAYLVSFVKQFMSALQTSNCDMGVWIPSFKSRLR